MVLLAVGCACVTAGIALVSIPLAFIAAGASLIFIALLVNYR